MIHGGLVVFVYSFGGKEDHLTQKTASSKRNIPIDQYFIHHGLDILESLPIKGLKRKYNVRESFLRALRSQTYRDYMNPSSQQLL